MHLCSKACLKARFNGTLLMFELETLLKPIGTLGDFFSDSTEMAELFLIVLKHYHICSYGHVIFLTNDHWRATDSVMRLSCHVGPVKGHVGSTCRLTEISVPETGRWYGFGDGLIMKWKHRHYLDGLDFA